jgi:hypothetical protein
MASWRLGAGFLLADVPNIRFIVSGQMTSHKRMKRKAREANEGGEAETKLPRPLPIGLRKFDHFHLCEYTPRMRTTPNKFVRLWRMSTLIYACLLLPYTTHMHKNLRA